MTSNDLPSEKRDGATDPNDQNSHEQLLSELRSGYGDLVSDVTESCLPDTRTEELVTLLVEHQRQLDNRGEVERERSLELTNIVAESLAEVEDATVVSPENLPADRTLGGGEAVITPDERTEVVKILTSILFAISDTPSQ